MSGDRDITALASVGELVEDAGEETFLLFSQSLPHNDLGIINDKVDELDIEVGGHSYSILQSSSLLKAARAGGTTGAMVWKVTPRIAEWLASDQCALYEVGILGSSKTILELGCGVAGVIGMAMSPLVASYILTDQAYVLRLLRENIARNQESQPSRSKASTKKVARFKQNFQNLSILPLDWEQDSVQNIHGVLSAGNSIDILLICDCVYNGFLIEPLTQMCIDICKDIAGRQSIVMIAQQLRTDDVFEEWLTRFLRDFHVWRMKDDVLPLSLQSSSGYVVHLASLRSNEISSR